MKKIIKNTKKPDWRQKANFAHAPLNDNFIRTRRNLAKSVNADLEPHVVLGIPTPEAELVSTLAQEEPAAPVAAVAEPELQDLLEEENAEVEVEVEEAEEDLEELSGMDCTEDLYETFTSSKKTHKGKGLED